MGNFLNILFSVSIVICMVIGIFVLGWLVFNSLEKKEEIKPESEEFIPIELDRYTIISTYKVNLPGCAYRLWIFEIKDNLEDIVFKLGGYNGRITQLEY